MYTIKYKEEFVAISCASPSIMIMESVKNGVSAAGNILNVEFKDIPDSFWRGLEDISLVRTIDIDKAHQDKPEED